MREPEGRTWFTPADSPQTGMWFTRDPRAIAAYEQLGDVALAIGLCGVFAAFAWRRLQGLPDRLVADIPKNQGSHRPGAPA